MGWVRKKLRGKAANPAHEIPFKERISWAGWLGYRCRFRHRHHQLSPILYLAIRMGFLLKGNIMRYTEKIALKTSLAILLFTLTCSSVFAESRSATVRVSCTILPMLEISMPKTASQTTSPWALPKASLRDELELKTNGSLVNVGTNLGKDYCVSEILLNKPEGRLKLYSVTAL